MQSVWTLDLPLTKTENVEKNGKKQKDAASQNVASFLIGGETFVAVFWGAAKRLSRLF